MSTTYDSLALALAAFYTKAGTIHKDAKAQYGKFADLSGVLSIVNPALAECGLAITQQMEDDGDNHYLVTTLHHSTEKVISKTRLILDESQRKRNQLHAWGGAVTYARRYSLLAILNLNAGIEDNDGNPAAEQDPPSVKPAPTPKQAQKPAATTADKPEIDDPPMSEERKEEVFAALASLRGADTSKFDLFCTDFRALKGVNADIKVAPLIQSESDYNWCQDKFKQLLAA